MRCSAWTDGRIPWQWLRQRAKEGEPAASGRHVPGKGSRCRIAARIAMTTKRDEHVVIEATRVGPDITLHFV